MPSFPSSLPQETGESLQGSGGGGWLHLGARQEPYACPGAFSKSKEKALKPLGEGQDCSCSQSPGRPPVSGNEAGALLSCLRGRGGSPPGTRPRAKMPCFWGKVQAQPAGPEEGAKALLG